MSTGYCTALFDNLFEQFDVCQQWAVLRARSLAILLGWLAAHQFDLPCQEFHDALALQYKKPLLNLSPYCDGCGGVFSVDHALHCQIGGLVGQRHNEVHDAIGNLASLAWGQVQKEPAVQRQKSGWWFGWPAAQ